MTETQALKLLRILLVTMSSVTIYQSLVIWRLSKQLNYGRNQFNKLHEAAIYLLEIMEQNDIDLTEFDLIALTAINEGQSNEQS